MRRNVRQHCSTVAQPRPQAQDQDFGRASHLWFLNWCREEEMMTLSGRGP